MEAAIKFGDGPRDESDELARLVEGAQRELRQGEGGLAFALLTKRLRGPVLAFSVIRLNGRADAEDVTQETLTRVWRSLPRYVRRAGIPFEAWVFKIPQNCVVDALTGLRPTEPADPDRVEGRLEKALAAISLAGWHVKEAIDASRLDELMGELPAAQRQVLLLRIVAEMTQPATAVVLGRTVDSVNSHERRALRFLRAHLTDQTLREQDVRPMLM